MAPATAGRAGAPWRKPISAPASSGNDISGIAVMHTFELLPTSRVIIGSRCGIIISPPMPAVRIPAGINSSPAPAAQRGFRSRQMQADGNRRDRQRQRHREFQVEERIAHRGHDVGPDAEFGEEHQQRDRRRGKQRQHQCEADRSCAMRIVGRKGSNELIGIHSHCSRNFAVRLVSPAMQRHPHRAFAHRKLRRRILDRGAVDRDRLQHVALPRRQRLQLGRDLACRGRLRGRFARQRLGEIVDVDENPSAPAAQRIDQLVAGDRKQPWRERGARVPGMPLQMHRQQNVLHDILGLIDRLTGARQAAPRGCPEHRRDGLEQAVIRRIVA